MIVPKPLQNWREQNELDAYLKEPQQIEFVGQLKNADVVNAGVTQSMFVLTDFKKIKEMRLKFS